MKILTVPDKTLTTKSDPVTKPDKKLASFIRDLEQTLINKKNPEGVGLSAPQVGKTIRVFSTLLGDKDHRAIATYINPVITKVSPDVTLGGQNRDKPYLEGCLSIPTIYGPVYRHQWIELEFMVLDPNTFSLIQQTQKTSGFEARVIQHEHDHLEGILFTRRTLEHQLPLYQEIDGELVEIEQ